MTYQPFKKYDSYNIQARVSWQTSMYEQIQRFFHLPNKNQVYNDIMIPLLSVEVWLKNFDVWTTSQCLATVDASNRIIKGPHPQDVHSPHTACFVAERELFPTSTDSIAGAVACRVRVATEEKIWIQPGHGTPSLSTSKPWKVVVYSFCLHLPSWSLSWMFPDKMFQLTAGNEFQKLF